MERKPHLKLIGKRTKTAERRIRSLLKRRKPFFLTTLNVEDNQTEEVWFVDSRGWVSMNESIGLVHIKNCLEFLGGPQPIWYDPERPVKRAYVRRSVRRGSG